MTEKHNEDNMGQPEGTASEVLRNAEKYWDEFRKQKPIEKIPSLEEVGESDDKNIAEFLVNSYDEAVNGVATTAKLNEIIKKFPNLRIKIISKIDFKIEEEKFQSKIDALERLKNKLPKK